MKRVALIGALAALILAGCGEAKLDHGTVISKVHEPETNTIIFIPIQTGCIPMGTTGGCTPIFTPFPFFLHDGEDWKLELHDKESGKTGWDYVDRAEWETTPIGAHISKAATKDPSLTEKRK